MTLELFLAILQSGGPDLDTYLTEPVQGFYRVLSGITHPVLLRSYQPDFLTETLPSGDTCRILTLSPEQGGPGERFWISMDDPRVAGRYMLCSSKDQYRESCVTDDPEEVAALLNGWLPQEIRIPETITPECLQKGLLKLRLESGEDLEMARRRSENLMIRTLRSLGYGKAMDIYEQLPR